MDIDFPEIAIVCECIPFHDWMSFASWYSISKRIPDAKVTLESGPCQFFGWARRLGVGISRKSKANLRVSPTVMAVRDFEGDLSVSPAKTDTQTCLVDCSEGCGNFVVDEWINTSKVPFFNSLKRFGTGRLTVNEMAILNVWEQCHNLYLHAGGS